MNNKILPKCHPYWKIGDEITDNRQLAPIAYTAQGYLLPCCFCDTQITKETEQYAKFGLFNQNLKVENVDDIEDILTSSEWQNFHETLLKDPQSAPAKCKHTCGTNEAIL